MVDGRRRLILTGAVGAGAVLLMGHSPYRRWSQYRALHTVIAADRSDPRSFPLGERLAARLGASRPDFKPLAGAAQSPATVASLLATRQLDLGLLRAEDAYHAMARAEQRPDLSAPLRTLAALAPEYLYVLVVASSPIRAIGDLSGRRVGVVEDGGRARTKTQRVLAATGLDPDTDVRWASLGHDEALAALARGAIDTCAIESSSLDAGRAVPETPPGVRLHVVSNGHAIGPLVSRHGPIYYAATPVGGSHAHVAVDGQVLGEVRVLVCRDDYPAERARAVAGALQGWSESAPHGVPLPVPLHAALRAAPDASG